MSDLSAAQPDQTIPQATAQAFISPLWMVRAYSRQLRAVSIGGGILSLVQPAPLICQYSLNQTNAFR